MQRDQVRLIGMLGMLLVLGMLILRARDPAMWEWLVPAHAPQPQPALAVEETKPQVAAEEPSGPTDLEPEERDAAAEVFQAVSDGTLEIQPEEMPSYQRLLDWSEHQSAPALLRRAETGLSFNQLMQHPAEYRGRLVTLDLHVARILSYQHQGRTLYEVWGWTDETKGWLYVAVVLDLPKGMPTGPRLHENARFAGYFFKLQGYHEAAAKPHAAPLKAPLLVGRLLAGTAGAPSVNADTTLPGGSWWAVAMVVGLAGVVILGSIALPLLRIWRRRQRSPAPGACSAALPLPVPLELPEDVEDEFDVDDQFPRVS